MNARTDIVVLLSILLTYALGVDVENVQLELLFFIAVRVAIISHKKICKNHSGKIRQPIKRIHGWLYQSFRNCLRHASWA